MRPSPFGHPFSLPRRVLLGLLVALVALGASAHESGSRPAESPPPPDRTKIEVLANERFSETQGRAGLCDVYLPAAPAPTSGYPAVIVVHGGGWMSGDKWTIQGYSRLLANSGFVAVTINYRLAPTFKFPAQVDDVREALLWTKANAKRLSIDLDRLGMFGYSAGGHLSTLVASLADEPIAVQAAASDWEKSDVRWQQLPMIHAVCAGGPPCDFQTLPIDNTALAYFLGGSRREKPEVYLAASPSAYVSPSDPVTQIIHGDKDLIVPIAGSRCYHQRQVAAGVDSRLEVMSGQGHMVTFLNPKTSEKVVAFFNQVLATSP